MTKEVRKMDEEGKTKEGSVVKKALKWGAIGFVIGIIMPYVMGGEEIRRGGIPAFIGLYLINSVVSEKFVNLIFHESLYYEIFNGFVVGILFGIIGLILSLFNLNKRR